MSHFSNRQKVISIWLFVFSPLIILAVILYMTSLGFFGSLPSFEELENPKSNLATEIISSDGVVLGSYFFENRSNVKYQDISPNMINALIATEDIRFYSHSGIDVRALVRAVVKGIATNQSSGGGSTITQQLAKMLFTKRPASGVERIMQKLKEWIIAVRLERQYTKDEILTMYLNKFDFINNAVGIKSAAKVYFNTNPSELNLQESAVLVGMLKNPSLYNPNRRLENTLNRRNIVLSQMKKYDFLSAQQCDSLSSLPIVLDFKKASHDKGLAPYLREYLRGELRRWCTNKVKADGSNYNLYTDGLKVYTTINSKMQQHAESAVHSHISSLQDDFYKHWKGYTNAPFPKDFSTSQIKAILEQGMKRSDRYQKLKKTNRSTNEIKRIFNTKAPMKVFSWKGEVDTIMSPMDSIKYYKYFIHSGLMSMDPHTGHVKAYVGGINYKHFKYDHVKVGKRQVGSTFKPFLYALALQEGYSPCYEVPNVPVVFEKDKWGLPEKDWVPRNSDDKFNGILMNLKFGMANSINTVTAFIMKQFGPHSVLDLAKKMGIKSNLEPVPSICLGTFDLSVYEMVGAYSTFVNKGVWTEPIFIQRIEDKNGIVLEEFQPETNEAMSEKTANLMIKMLQGVVDGVYNPHAETKLGTGVRLRRKYKFENEIGGKTGTTQNNSDGWFMGITPNLVTGVWSGNEDRSVHFRTTFYGQGANMALPVWAEYMTKVYQDSTELGIFPVDFDIPTSLDIFSDCGSNQQSIDTFEEEF
ncbi:MAG: transglycosylase domain-containing protein [Bacteroidota bacterium]|nr:transglycosylase domain-containing protein [Bacteroidota bacterium]